MAFNFGGSGQQRPTSGPPGSAPVPPGSAPVPPGGPPSTRTGGFQGAPTPRQYDTPTVPSVPEETPHYGQNQNWNQPHPSRSPIRAPRTGPDLQIPWRIVIPILLIAAAIALCVVYRDSITEFLSQILTWVIIIIVIFLLLRWLVFGGRRRR